MVVAPLVRQQAGAFVCYIGTSPEKEEAARAGFLAEFARLCDAPVTAAELERAKRFAVGDKTQVQGGTTCLPALLRA